MKPANSVWMRSSYTESAGTTAPQCCELSFNYFTVFLTGCSSDRQPNRVCRVILGFLHVVRVCTSGFDCLSSAKRSPFSPTPSCHNMYESGFFPPVESVIQNSKKHINLANQKREIYVRKRSREPKKPPILRAF